MKPLPQSITSHDPRIQQMFKDILARLRMQRVRGSATILANETANGTLLEATAKATGGGGGASAAAGYFSFVSAQSDYINCNPVTAWASGSPTINTGTVVKVARPVDLRCSETSALIDTVTWTYSYTTFLNRQATSSTFPNGFIEVIIPRYIAGAIIFAVKPPNGTGVAGADYQEVSARCWSVNQTA